MHRRLYISLAAVALGAGLVPFVAPAQQSPTVVIVARHAEKAATPADNPPLTEAGTVRAKALAAALAEVNLQAVISTPLARTLETGRPAAEARGLTIETVPTGGMLAHASAVAAAVRKHTGKTILVVGHSNTVSPIIAALGGPRLRDLCDSEYSELFTLVLDGAAARLIRATYGAPSPVPPTGCSGPMR